MKRGFNRTSPGDGSKFQLKSIKYRFEILYILPYPPVVRLATCTCNLMHGKKWPGLGVVVEKTWLFSLPLQIYSFYGGNHSVFLNSEMMEFTSILFGLKWCWSPCRLFLFTFFFLKEFCIVKLECKSLSKQIYSYAWTDGKRTDGKIENVYRLIFHLVKWNWIAFYLTITGDEKYRKR